LLRATAALRNLKLGKEDQKTGIEIVRRAPAMSGGGGMDF
jgi:hypothetical protein